MVRFAAYRLTAFLAVANSAAHPAMEERAINCAPIADVVSAVELLGALATPYCSAYLKVPGTSVTTTITTPVS